MKKPRVALVTGGGSGIGRSTALLLAEAGNHLVVVDVNGKNAKAVCHEIESMGGTAIGVECDVQDNSAVVSSVSEAIARFGTLDILVNSAGIDLHHSFVDLELGDWHRTLDTNLTGSFLFIKHASKPMIANGYGRIICVGSTSGLYGMGWPAYSASKAALNGLVLSAAREMAKGGVTVNLVAPGPIDTPLTKQLWDSGPGRRQELERRCPTGRIGTAEEVARAIEFLASEGASYITGTTLVVDGGFTSLLAPT